MTNFERLMKLFYLKGRGTQLRSKFGHTENNMALIFGSELNRYKSTKSGLGKSVTNYTVQSYTFTKLSRAAWA